MAGRFGEKPDVSGIYRSLKKMEATGLVTSNWETGARTCQTALRDYGAGRASLARWTTTLETYLEIITALLQDARAAMARRPKRRHASPRSHRVHLHREAVG